MTSTATSMAKSSVKMSAMSAFKGKVMEQAADENTKLGGFLKKGTAVAEKTVNKIVNSEVSFNCTLTVLSNG